MNPYWGSAFAYALMAITLLFATDHVAAASTNPQVLYAFCELSFHCTDEQQALGYGAQGIVAGPDDAYYGTTSYSVAHTIGSGNDSIGGGGSIYRADPTTRTLRALYEFPRGYYPAAWLKAGSDGYVYGGYVQRTPKDSSEWVSEGLFRISPTGELKIIYEESFYPGFALNAPVLDNLGNWIGITSDPYNYRNSPDFVYKITPAGGFKILHTLSPGQHFDRPNYEPVLAADGNMYGVFLGGDSDGSSGAIYRVAPDDSFTIVRTFDLATDGRPATPLTLGPDGALYGTLQSKVGGINSLYRMSLDGQFANLGTFGPANYFRIFSKLTLMPDGYFYGSARLGERNNVIFRLSPTGQYTPLYVNPRSGGVSSMSLMIRGFDNALYGTSFYDGRYHGGTLFRYVPPPVQ